MNRTHNYVLALDVGERRIGMALASTVARLPAPFGVIDRLKITDAYAKISEIVQKEQISAVVVGLPRGLNGQDTQQTAIARQFASDLTQKIDIPVVMQDEAATSIEAERLLKARGKAYEKGDIDSEAAALILRDYLNQMVRLTA